jgi:hypothetical protein
MTETLTYNHLNVLADALSRLEDQTRDGYDPTQIYVGVWPADHPLRSAEAYKELLGEASEVVTDLMAATGDKDTVALEVQQDAASLLA